jgi:hypothetical protein
MAGLAGCAALLLFAGAAKADSTITYIFTGTATGTLNGTAFSGSFTVTGVADPSDVTTGGGEYRNVPTSLTFTAGALTATFSDPVIIENTAAPGYMGFAETISPYSDESLENVVFETYGLDTALATTTGTLSVAPATFATSVGDLDFTGITALSFEATTAVPEPSSLALLAGVLLACVAIRRRVYRTSTSPGH